MIRPHLVWLVSIGTAAALWSAACNGSELSSSPTAPSRSGGSSSGAIISGRVITSGGATFTSTTATTAATNSITVRVSGTNIATTVNGQGQFTLTDVPPGTVRIEFSGTGTSATVVITGVGASDRVDITVMLNGNRATVQSQSVEVDGAVSGLEGTCPSVTFLVRGRRVRTDAGTDFEHGSCASLQNNSTVEVKGRAQADGSLMADEVEFEDEDDDDEDREDDEDDDEDDDVELRGRVSGLTGTCPVLTFTLSATTVVTDRATRFEDRCSAVRNGRSAEVKGVRLTNGQLRATKVEIDD